MQESARERRIAPRKSDHQSISQSKWHIQLFSNYPSSSVACIQPCQLWQKPSDLRQTGFIPKSDVAAQNKIKNDAFVDVIVAKLRSLEIGNVQLQYSLAFWTSTNRANPITSVTVHGHWHRLERVLKLCLWCLTNQFYGEFSKQGPIWDRIRVREMRIIMCSAFGYWVQRPRFDSTLDFTFF